MEMWRQVIGFPLYEVSSEGHIRRGGHCLKLLIHRSQNGRKIALIAVIRKDGKSFRLRIHRIVLEAFIGQCPAGLEGCHNDGNCENNRVENLRWDTHQSNYADMLKHGRQNFTGRVHGKEHHMVTLTSEQVKEIRQADYSRFGSKAAMARKMGIHHATLWGIRTGFSRRFD